MNDVEQRLREIEKRAEQCLARDRRSCRRQGGTSDRVVRRIEGDTLADVRRILASYDVTRGPGSGIPEIE